MNQKIKKYTSPTVTLMESIESAHTTAELVIFRSAEAKDAPPRRQRDEKNRNTEEKRQFLEGRASRGRAGRDVEAMLRSSSDLLAYPFVHASSTLFAAYAAQKSRQNSHL